MIETTCEHMIQEYLNDEQPPRIVCRECKMEGSDCASCGGTGRIDNRISLSECPFCRGAGILWKKPTGTR
jgi:hypothetical protein